MTQETEKEVYAIEVEGLSKTFRVPHERHKTLKATALNIFNARKYTEFKALEDVSFKIKKGEFVGIIGPNGSGKSTLLKILAGIYIPDAGKLSINGKLSPFLELGVGFNPELTARENVFLGGAILGLTRVEVAEKLDDIINFAELNEFIDMKYKNFSSGMQVRLAFSLAINAHAEVLLMDEVLAVGDSTFQEKCINKFIEYKRDNKTIVLVSHDLLSISKYCDRAILLEKGNILMEGLPNKVVTRYYEGIIDDKPKDQIEDKEAKERDIYIESAKIVPNKLGQLHYDLFEDVKVQVNYHVKKELNNPVFGISIYNRMGTLLFAANSKEKRFKTGIIKPGKYSLSFIFKNVFLDDVFFISSAIADDRLIHFYDRKDGIAQFRVNTNLENKGLIETECRIIKE